MLQSVLQFILKLSSGVEVRALDFSHSSINTPCLHGVDMVHRGIVIQEQLSMEGHYEATA